MTTLLVRRNVLEACLSVCFSLPFPCRRCSSSSRSSPVNQPSPRVYGLASGDPLTLSMLSSRRGARNVGYVGALGGTMVGLNVALDGGRRWLEAAFGWGCLAGEVRAVMKGGGLFGFWGAGEGFRTGCRVVVVRTAPGVRLAANARDAFDGPAAAFFGVAAIMRAMPCDAVGLVAQKRTWTRTHRSLQLSLGPLLVPAQIQTLLPPPVLLPTFVSACPYRSRTRFHPSVRSATLANKPGYLRCICLQTRPW